MSTQSIPSGPTIVNNMLHDTPFSPTIDILLNGTILDLLDSAHRVSRTDRFGLVAWIDSAVSFALTGAMALVRLVSDLALTVFFALTWPFSAASRNSCKVHLFRSLIDLTGAALSFASIFYPPLIKTIHRYMAADLYNDEKILKSLHLLHQGLNCSDPEVIKTLREKFDNMPIMTGLAGFSALFFETVNPVEPSSLNGSIKDLLELDFTKQSSEESTISEDSTISTEFFSN